MSTFKGRMVLYSNIAIDRFDGLNLRCTAFFLSHCHKDHMTGLDDKKFEVALKARSGVFLYCTEITRLLLLADEEYKPLEPFIRTLPVGPAQSIQVPKEHSDKGQYEVKVTAVSAGHCPGSAMFLFEGDQGTCLYTGDFRWEVNYASTVTAFGTPQRLKVIDHVHVDTTFCEPRAYHIPSRVECADATVSVVAQWLGRSPQHQVAFYCPARYGYEFLLREIATRLDLKIHVSNFKVTLYDQIPDLAGLFTSDPSKARVHACCAKMRKKASLFPPCVGLSKGCNTNASSSTEEQGNLVLNIRPCAMWFTAKTGRDGLQKLMHVPASPRGLQRVCYSMHSSYSEIQDLVSYLKPRHVWPNVIPTAVRTPQQIQNYLDSFLERTHPLRPRVVRQEDRTKSQGRQQACGTAGTKTSFLKLLAQESDSSDNCCFSSQESNDSKPVEAATNTDAGELKVLERKNSPEGKDSPAGSSRDNSLQQQEQVQPDQSNSHVQADQELLLRLSSDSVTSRSSPSPQSSSPHAAQGTQRNNTDTLTDSQGSGYNSPYRGPEIDWSDSVPNSPSSGLSTPFMGVETQNYTDKATVLHSLENQSPEMQKCGSVCVSPTLDNVELAENIALEDDSDSSRTKSGGKYKGTSSRQSKHTPSSTGSVGFTVAVAEDTKHLTRSLESVKDVMYNKSTCNSSPTYKCFGYNSKGMSPLDVTNGELSSHSDRGVYNAGCSVGHIQERELKDKACPRKPAQNCSLSEDEEEIIHSSPISSAKAYGALLKGRLCKTFPDLDTEPDQTLSCSPAKRQCMAVVDSAACVSPITLNCAANTSALYSRNTSVALHGLTVEGNHVRERTRNDTKSGILDDRSLERASQSRVSSLAELPKGKCESPLKPQKRKVGVTQAAVNLTSGREFDCPDTDGLGQGDECDAVIVVLSDDSDSEEGEDSEKLLQAPTVTKVRRKPSLESAMASSEVVDLTYDS